MRPGTRALSSLTRARHRLFATQQRATPASATKLTSLGAFFDTQQERLAIISLPQETRCCFRRRGGDALRADRPARRARSSRRRAALRCTRPHGPRKQAVVLLRPTKLAIDLRAFAAVHDRVRDRRGGRRRDRRRRRLPARTRRLAAGRAGLRRQPRPRRRGTPRAALPVAGSTEVAALATSFNQLAADLDHARTPNGHSGSRSATS